MSKANNRNPDFYDEGTRNHQGEGIQQESNKQRLAQEKAREHSEGKPGDRNFIPGAAPVGEKQEK